MKKDKRIKFILIMLLFLVVILFICLVTLNKVEDSTDKDELILTDPVYISEENRKIYPENSYQLVYTYSGKQNLTSEFYNKIYRFEEYIRQISQKVSSLNEKQVEEYFDLNSYTIKSFTGITELAEFKKLVKNIDIFTDSSITLEKAVFNIDEKEVTEDYTICPLSFYYTNGNELVVDLYISNSYSSAIKLKFVTK